MVLSNAIIFISVFVGKQRRSDGCRLLLNLKVYCLVLVEVHGRRALLQTRRFLTFSVESCLDALNIILFFSFFFFSFPAQILEPKNLFCDSNVLQPYL